jgi:ferric-dicitrate binding protein FerR (iron transport regulator)
MDADFNTLLDRYFENDVTHDEEWQLMHLIHQGAHQRQLEQRIDRVLQENVEHRMMRVEALRLNLKILRRSTRPDTDETYVVTTATSWFAAAACLSIVFVIGIWLYNNPRAPRTDAHANVFLGKGVYYLPDSSTILLNGDSELTYTYSTIRREVALSGEAYFYIHHDPHRPFYVRTDQLLTRVLGTSFSVRAYAGQKDFMVAVTEGSVQVSNGAETRSYGVLAHDEQLAVNPQTAAMVKTKRKEPPILAWRKAFLILDDVTLKEAGELIHDRYGATLTFKNPELEKCEVNAKFFNDEELTTVLGVVTSALGLTYAVERGEVIIDRTAPRKTAE